MITAGNFKKGVVITFEGHFFSVEDYHIQKTAQRRPTLHTKLRNLKTGQIIERAFDEAERFEQPEFHSRTHQYLYQDGGNYVFMDAETFEQITVPGDMIGNGKWALAEGAEFMIRLIDDRPVQVVIPPNFIAEVVETADPSGGGAQSNVLKEAKLANGLMVKVPLFIKIGDHIKIDTETHKYMGKESAKR